MFHAFVHLLPGRYHDGRAHFGTANWFYCRQCRIDILKIFFITFFYSFAIGFLALTIAGCYHEIAKIPMEPISTLMPMIITLEQQADHTLGMIQMMSSLGIIKSEDHRKLKAHWDLYVVLHVTAMVYLTEVRKAEYESIIITAAAELDKMDEILKAAMRNRSEEKKSKLEF